jgi:hypothetical protein
VLIQGNTYSVSPKIFVKEDSEKQRVTFNHVKAFYENFYKKKLGEDEILHYFAHYLQGKT